MNFRTNAVFAALFLAVLPLCSIGQIPLVAAPMRSKTPRLQFPRVSGLRDSAVKRQVNAVLAAREKQDLQTLRFCAHVAHFRGAKDEDSETLRVSYLSNMLLSLDVRVTFWNCAPYPQTNLPEPITIDLRSGHELDWHAFFLSGFLPDSGADGWEKPAGPIPGLKAMYLSRYKQDSDCTAQIRDSGFPFDLWLDRRSGSLVAVPDVPHVIRACADEVAIPFSEVLPYVADKAAASDLAR